MKISSTSFATFFTLISSIAAASISTSDGLTCGEPKNVTCPNGLCCSKYGYCGTGDSFCSLISGCQQKFTQAGLCTTAEPQPGTLSPDGTCGPKNHGYVCGDGNCCSSSGYCGSSNDFCAFGCQNGFGKCFSPDGSCGPKNGFTCGDGNCCSSSGYCGSSNDYCGSGCQNAFGKCF